MEEFKSLAEFVKAIMRVSDSEADTRLIPDNSPEIYFTEEELFLMEQFADNLMLRSKEDGRTYTVPQMQNTLRKSYRTR